MGIFGAIATSGTDGYVPVMRFEPVATTGDLKALPRYLAEPEAVGPATAVQRRQFVLDNGICGQRTAKPGHADMPTLIGINGKAHDPVRIDVETKLGTGEIWEIVSVGMPHPFHIHGAFFRVLSLGGAPLPRTLPAGRT